MCLGLDRYMYMKRVFAHHNRSLPCAPLTALTQNDHVTSLDALLCFILLVTIVHRLHILDL